MRKHEKQRRGAEWLLAFRQGPVEEAASIMDRVCPTRGLSLDSNFSAFKGALEALADGSPSHSYAFIEALERLPAILQHMKEAPRGDVREARQVQKFELNGLDAFIKACELGINWVREPHNRGLEAAMFFRFTQAFKWWRASDKVYDAFWHKLLTTHW